LRPDRSGEPYRRCLIALSRGGADATVVREFDLQARRFVTDGFSLPNEAKQDVEWKDFDTVWVATDFGPGSMTASGYPRIVKEWKRGQRYNSADGSRAPPTSCGAFSSGVRPASRLRNAGPTSTTPSVVSTAQSNYDDATIRRADVPDWPFESRPWTGDYVVGGCTRIVSTRSCRATAVRRALCADRAQYARGHPYDAQCGADR
jgi:hypothetical protein